MKDHVRTFEGPLGDLWGTFEGREVAFLVGSCSGDEATNGSLRIES